MSAAETLPECTLTDEQREWRTHGVLAPVVGMACTLCFYTDRHPGTVVAVSKSGHKIMVREDRAIRTDDNGMSEAQSYRYESDPTAEPKPYYRQGNGTYGKGPRIVLGWRREYRDFSF